MTTTRFLAFWSIAALALLARTGFAHEFWIEPSALRAATGTTIALRLRVGDGFPGEPVARNPRLLERFVVIDPDGKEIEVVGRPGEDPAGHARLDKPGFHVVAYRSRPSTIELEASQFEAYLHDEGLERISQWRAQHGQSGESGRERYSRCAKSIIAVGGMQAAESSTGFDRAAGLPLELFPTFNPAAVRAGETLTFQLHYRGAPLEGVLLGTFNPTDGATRLTARTDADGRASFTLPRGGLWLINAVHMTAVENDPKMQWESLWASLTFEIGEPAEATPPADSAAHAASEGP